MSTQNLVQGLDLIFRASAFALWALVGCLASAMSPLTWSGVDDEEGGVKFYVGEVRHRRLSR